MLGGLPSTSAHGVEEPWKLTVAERAAARVDPALRARRVQQAAHPAKGEVPADVLDGKVHPELFFPTEIFERLVWSAFVSLPNVYPRWLAAESKDLFRDADEWRRFVELSKDFATVLKKEHGLLEGQPAAGGMQGLKNEKCAAMAASLRAARAAFGQERFDRFLYETAASAMNETYGSEETVTNFVMAARQREENCR